MQTISLPFIKNDWTIIIKDIPSYTDFAGSFSQPLDYHLLQMIAETNNPNITPIMKQEIKDKLLPNINPQTGIMSVVHRQANGLGRFYANENVSIIPFSKYIKHTVFKYLDWCDIDMVKGHMSIAYEMGLSVGLSFNHIKRYIDDFPSICDEMREFYQFDEDENYLTDDDIKWLYCVMMYGGGLKCWVDGLTSGCEKSGYKPKQLKNTDKYSPFAELFKKESKSIIDRIYTKNISLVKKLRKPDEDTYKTKSTVASYWFQIIENHILYIVYQLLCEQKIIKPKVCAPEYDGLCIPPISSDIDRDSLIADINTIIRIKTGLKILMKWKDYSPSFILDEIIEQRKVFVPPIYAVAVQSVESIDDNQKRRFVQDDNQAGNLIIADLKDVLICSKRDGRVFYKHKNVWVCDSNQINNHLLNYIISSNICKLNENKLYVPYAQNVKSARNIRDAVLVKISAIDYDFDIYDKLHSTTKGRIAFKDGVLDFKSKRFYSWDSIDFEYYTPIMINYEFKEYFQNPNMEDIATIKRDVFQVLFGNKLDTALHFLSRGIAGHCEDKNWASYLGNRDCGKGVIYDGLKSAFEEYVQTFELGNVIYERHRDNQEVSRKLYWILDLEFCRLAISQEVPDSPNMKLDGKMWKKLTGGGDTHVVRRNYDRKDTHCNSDTTFMPMGNSHLNPDSKDVDEHRLELQSVIQFKTQQEIDMLREQGASELVLSAYRVKDPTIKDKIKSDAWKRAIVYLLFQNYRDEPVSIIREADCDDELVSLRSLIDREYEITCDDSDMVLVSDMVGELSCNKKKLVNELNSMCVYAKKCKNRDSLYRDKMCFFRIKKRTGEDGDTTDESEM